MMTISSVGKVFAALLLSIIAASAQADAVKIPEGTEARLRLLDKLSSASSVEGQRFNLELDEDISLNGIVVIPRGAKAAGTVLSVHKRARMGKAGELNIQIDYLLVGEQRIRVRASTGREGDSKVGTAVTLTVLFGPLGLLKRGKDVEINPGTIFTAYVDQTTMLE